MKAKILASLKNKYAHLGFGERAFDGVADYLSKTVEKEEDIETAILGVESLLKAFQADADKVRTEKASAEKRLSELQDQVKTLGGAPDRKDEPEKKDTDPETPSWAKALIESNKALSERLSAMEGEKVVTVRKQQLSSIVEKLPEPLRKPYARIGLKDLSDDDFNALKSEIENEVSGLLTDTRAKGAVFGRPSALGGQAKPEGELTKEQLEAIAHRDGAPTDGQPF